MSDSEQEAWQQDEFDGMKAEIAQLREELSRYQDGYKGSCYACEVVGERNVSLEAEVAQLRAELIDSEKQRAWLQNELVKKSSSEGHQASRKADCVAFFQWWWNQPGNNTEQGYDAWQDAWQDASPQEGEA